MRTEVKAGELQVGMYAFLPYYRFAPRKAKITAIGAPVFSTLAQKSFITISYSVLSDPGSYGCSTWTERFYEVYTRSR